MPDPYSRGTFAITGQRNTAQLNLAIIFSDQSDEREEFVRV